MSKTRMFTLVGESTRNGKRRLRATNRPGYAAVLAEEGDKDIEMHQLPRPMTKPEAREWLAARLDALMSGMMPEEAFPE
jgi:hypothetical protein